MYNCIIEALCIDIAKYMKSKCLYSLFKTVVSEHPFVSKYKTSKLLTCDGSDSISEAFWARVSRLTSWDTRRFLLVLWMTPVGAA